MLFRQLNYLLGIGLILLPQGALAHVRWFVSDVQEPVSLPADEKSFWLVLGAALFLVLSRSLQNHAAKSDRLSHWLNGHWVSSLWPWQCLRACIVAMLVGNLVLGDCFAPNLVFDQAHWAVCVYQGVLALALIVSPLVFSLLAIAGLLALPWAVGLELSVDYWFEFLALALVMLWLAPNLSALDKRLVRAGPRLLNFYNRIFINCQRLAGASMTTQALSLLRVGIGVQLLVLAVHNKLLNPELALAFINQNSFYNFMPLLGFERFCNLHFVLAAGIAEACFGIALIMNWSTRVIMIFVGGAFLTTSILTGLHELVGHLPFLGVTAVLLLVGRQDPALHSCKDHDSTRARENVIETR